MLSIHIEGTPLLQFRSLPENEVFAFTTTVEGGVSKDAYDSFNLGFYAGDDVLSVSSNRLRLANSLGVGVNRLFVPYQTHEDAICVIDESFLASTHDDQQKALHGVDALITDRKGIAIGITTADCVPVVAYDCRKKVFAAIHAGWKGTVNRIAAKTVIQMITCYGCQADDILVSIGPSISPEVYEVGDDIGTKFSEAGFDLERISFRNHDTNKLHLDLWAANKIQLEEVGIRHENIEIAELCTYSLPDLFFSARRQSIHSGRMITGGIIR